MKKFCYNPELTLIRFWRNEKKELINAKHYLLNYIIPFFENNKDYVMKHYNPYILKIKEHKALILDSGDYKRVYFFLKRNKNNMFCDTSKLDDYNAKYLMFMFYISLKDYNDSGDLELINKTLLRVLNYLIDNYKNDYIKEMLWNNAAFERDKNIFIEVCYNETREQQPIKMNYLDMMFNIEVLCLEF